MTDSCCRFFWTVVIMVGMAKRIKRRGPNNALEPKDKRERNEEAPSNPLDLVNLSYIIEFPH